MVKKLSPIPILVEQLEPGFELGTKTERGT